MCLYPKLIKNRKYTKNKKNGGVIPAITDERVKFVPIGCGNCMECRKQVRRDWQIRLQEEIRTNTNGKFITLTFSDESINKIIKQCTLQDLEGYELDNQIATKAMRLFLERWRKKHSNSLRHWFATELGHTGTENIHLHGIVWTNESIDTIRNIWQYGYIWPKPKSSTKNFVNNKTINYIIKYIHKVDKDHKFYKSIVLASPGIGKNYINRPDSLKNKYNDKNTIETYRTKSGHELSLPIYYRNKIYSETEREKLWLQKLDKNERWIMGEKVNADDHYNFYELLQHYRKLNKELGYGDDEKNWDREQYELERRKLLYAKRLNNIKNETKNNDNQ